MTQVVARRVLLNERARVAVRDLMSSTVLRDIDDMWQDEGFPPVTTDPEPVGGQRVTRFQGYLDQVDWADPHQVTRALGVFETALRWLFVPETDPARDPQPIWPHWRGRLRKLFGQDGYQISDDGRITGGRSITIAPALLDHVDDPHAIREHLTRIERAVGHDDAAQVIGSAKELVETTAKVVLAFLGEPVPENADMPALVRLVHVRLQIHPNSAEGPDGSAGVKKILGATTAIPNAVAELRNAGYGTGHGQSAARRGLSTRHARLVFNAARTWCEFVLDTLGDDRAPWRNAT